MVSSSAKCFTAPALVLAEVMSWQMVQSAVPAVAWVPQAWRPTASLYWEVAVPLLMA